MSKSYAPLTWDERATLECWLERHGPKNLVTTLASMMTSKALEIGGPTWPNNPEACRWSLAGTELLRWVNQHTDDQTGEPK